MIISKRLKTIAELVPNNSNVIDVGCDHALLDIYLSLEKNCTCQACDINKNALKQAVNNISKYNLETKIKTYLTDGLNNITINENDIIVIAGMGTNTIKHILNGNLSNTLIIASNNDIKELREYVIGLDYVIEEEKFINDKNKNYVIIKFKKGKKNYSNIDIEYGPLLRYNNDYINYLKNNLKNIKKKIPFYKFFIRYNINKKIKMLSKINS